MKKQQVYLSGGMQYANKEGASWRSSLGAWINEAFGHRVFDPTAESKALLSSLRKRGWRLRGSNRTGGDWPRFFRLIVDRDSRFVRSSDYVVCLWNMSARKGAGTQGELTLAREARIPVYLVSRSPLDRIPGWVQGCITKRFRTFQELRLFLSHRYGH